MAFRVNLNFRDQHLDQLPPLRLIHHAVQFFKIDQHFIDIVAGQLFRFNGLLFGSGCDQQRFRILDLIIHLVEPIIKVCLAPDIVPVVRVERIDLLRQLRLDGIMLAQLLLAIGNLLVNGGGIHFHVDFFLHHSRKLRIAHQPYNDFRHGIVQQFFPNLLFVIALMPTYHGAVLATVVVKILVLGAVRFVLDAFISIHSGSADRTFYNTGEQMYVFIFPSVDVFVFLGLRQQLHLRRLPNLFRNNWFVQTICQQVVVLLHQLVLISGAAHFFHLAAAIGNFSAVHRIFQNQPDQVCIKQGILPILPGNLADTVVFQILCNAVCANVRVNILVIDDTNRLCFFLVDHQFSIYQLIPIGGKATVPAALPCLLDAALHGLDTNIFPLNLRHGRQDRDHQFARVLGRINAIFHTHQVDAKILHDLKGREHVRRVSAKPGQFEHQNIRHAVFAGFDVLHHLAELRPTFDRLAGLSRILIFTDDLIIVIVCVGFHFGFLCIQRIAIHLHSGGDSGIGVNFYLLFLHLNLPHVVPIEKLDWLF